MKKVLISGYYGWNNIGDDAILKYITEWLKENDISPVVICNNPELVKNTFGVETIGRENFGGIKEGLKNAHGYISGGGSLIQDVTSKKSALYYLMVLALANQYLKGKTFIYGQGLGPLNTSFLKTLTKVLFNKTAKIGVRDEQSLSFLKDELKVKQEISLMYDPVLLSSLSGTLNTRFTEQEENILNRKPVFFSVKNNKNDEKMIIELREVVRQLETQDIPVISIPFHKGQDTKITKEILDGFNNTYIFERELSIDEVLYVLQNSELVVGMRLHSLIMAAAMNTPFLPVSYDHKIDAFAKQFNVPVMYDIDGFDAQKTVESIKGLQNNYDFEKKKLKTLVDGARQRNEELNKEIVRIIKGQRR